MCVSIAGTTSEGQSHGTFMEPKHVPVLGYMYSAVKNSWVSLEVVSVLIGYTQSGM